MLIVGFRAWQRYRRVQGGTRIEATTVSIAGGIERARTVYIAQNLSTREGSTPCCRQNPLTLSPSSIDTAMNIASRLMHVKRRPSRESCCRTCRQRTVLLSGAGSGQCSFVHLQDIREAVLGKASPSAGSLCVTHAADPAVVGPKDEPFLGKYSMAPTISAIRSLGKRLRWRWTARGRKPATRRSPTWCAERRAGPGSFPQHLSPHLAQRHRRMSDNGVLGSLDAAQLPARLCRRLVGAVVWMLASNRWRGVYRVWSTAISPSTEFAASRLVAGALPHRRTEVKPNFRPMRRVSGVVMATTPSMWGASVRICLPNT